MFLLVPIVCAQLGRSALSSSWPQGGNFFRSPADVCQRHPNGCWAVTSSDRRPMCADDIRQKSFIFRKDQIGNISPQEYPKVPNYYADVYQQSLQDNWQDHLPVPNGGEQSYKAIQDINPNWKLEEGKENPTHIQNKMAHELKYSKEHFEEPTENKQNKIEKHIRSEHNHDHSKYSISEIAEKLELQDGVAETPGGAILSLTLGLIITCLMAILIGCRLRVVRRRMRRGGKSYAHDADYLVNGMYL